MTSINPYITFDGNCEEAFSFYKSVFRTEYNFIGKFKEMPTNDEYPMPEEDAERIMHVSLPISNGSVLMGSDSSTAFGKDNVTGNNISISIHTKSVDEAKRLFEALSFKGKINMPLEKTFWGAYFGMLTDQFGINWQVNCELAEHKDFEDANRTDG